MLSSLIGGVIIAAVCILISLLKRSAQRVPAPLWARTEALESSVAIGLVALLALGFSFVASSMKAGWVAPALGVAVALVGAGFGAALTRQRTRPANEPKLPPSIRAA